MHVEFLEAILKVSACHQQEKTPPREGVYSFDQLFKLLQKIQLKVLLE